MSETNTIAARRALLLVFGGIALTVLGSSLTASTGRSVWRVVAVVGCLVQAAGWVLYAHRTPDGAA